MMTAFCYFLKHDSISILLKAISKGHPVLKPSKQTALLLVNGAVFLSILFYASLLTFATTHTTIRAYASFWVCCNIRGIQMSAVIVPSLNSLINCVHGYDSIRTNLLTFAATCAHIGIYHKFIVC